MMEPPAHGATLLAAVFAFGGHGKPDLHAKVRITQPPQNVQLAEPIPHGYHKGWWWTGPLPTSGGTYRVTASVPHQACASVTVTIPPNAFPEQRVGGEYEIRINCKR